MTWGGRTINERLRTAEAMTVPEASEPKVVQNDQHGMLLVALIVTLGGVAAMLLLAGELGLFDFSREVALVLLASAVGAELLALAFTRGEEEGS
jgi:hypothetical protein